jgi:two-component system cell cycle response regulator DivK
MMKQELTSDRLTITSGASSLRTILVVDDFDDTRLLLRIWLERRGFRVVEAENGLEAVNRATSETPDLIIMDMEMPRLDGLSATRRIREVPSLSKVPIVAVSAYGADQFREVALATGCDEYVSTPFEPIALEKIIRALIK